MRSTSRAAAFLSILLLGTLAPPAGGAPGELDRDFGTGGKAVRDVGGTDFVADVATRGRRGVYALVGFERRNDRATGVMSLRSNGRLDRDFGRSGIALVNLAGDEEPGGIAVAGNGRVVVSFSSEPSAADGSFGVARFRPSGRPDSSFDRDGVQTAGFGTGFSGAEASDVAVDGGEVVVAGTVFDGSNGTDDFALARFLSNGRLDESFDEDGRQTTDFAEESDAAEAVAVDGSHRLVVVGTANRFLSVDPLAIARYDQAGELDESFDEDGRLISNVAPEGVDVALSAGGAIMAGGTVSGDFLAARFTEAGALDDSFSGNGVQTVDFVDGADRLAALATDGSRLVLAGTVRTGRRGRDFGIARLRANGTLDRSFSDDGRRAVDLARGEDNATGASIDPTGDVVVGGWSERSDADSSLIRLDGRAGR